MSTINTYTLTVLVLFSLLPFALVAQAHGDELSWEVSSNGKVVDVGYDAPPVVGSYTRFDFNLKDEHTLLPADFIQVWVRITNPDTSLLATGVYHQVLGPTTLLFDFPAPGAYILSVSYRDKNDNEIATSSFPITAVGANRGYSGLIPFLGGVLGSGLFMFFVCWYLWRRV